MTLHLHRTYPLRLFPPAPSLSSRCFPLFIPNRNSSFPLFPTYVPKLQSQGPRVFSSAAERHAYPEEEQKGIEVSPEAEDLGVEGEVFKKTLRLVECSMFASVSGLAYILSNTLAIENYFGCFFPLPIVMSSMRWGVAAGRKTMVATSLLLFTLSGPIKASSYLLMYGLVGLTMGSLWKLEMDWGLSIVLCTLVRIIGVLGYVLLTSFVIRENILSLITINTHAGVTYALTSIGLNTIPSMRAIYILFGCLLLVNCGFFVFLLHIIYAVLLSKLGMKASLTLPRWLEESL